MSSSSGRNIVLTVATHDEGYLTYFKESCARYGIEPVIIGHGVTWKNFGTKFNIIREWVMEYVQNDDRLLIVDCYDLIFLRTLEPLFQRFMQDAEASPHGRYKYMYAASEPLWGPHKWLAGSFYGLYKNEVINSGSFMAYGKLIKDIFDDQVILEALTCNDIADDQELLIRYLQRNADVDCCLDKNQRFIVYFAYRIDIGARIDISDTKRVFYKGTECTSEPYLLHRHGHGNLRPILQKLGYDTTNAKIESNFLQRAMTCHVPNMIGKFIAPFKQLLPQ